MRPVEKSHWVSFRQELCVHIMFGRHFVILPQNKTVHQWVTRCVDRYELTQPEDGAWGGLVDGGGGAYTGLVGQLQRRVQLYKYTVLYQCFKACIKAYLTLSGGCKMSPRTLLLCGYIFLVLMNHWLYVCLYSKIEFCSCARGRQWCGIFHYHW